MQPLPVDDVIPQILSALETHSSSVLQAPPGAGKTTRVPLALLDAPWLVGQGIIMLEPRRLAAVNAACWMSQCLGETVGKSVGYSIRLERKVSLQTRIEVVTEGILARRMQTDPLLDGIGVVIFDEFHERNLATDLALALCLDVQQSLRPDLKILVMSATLDTSDVSRLLNGAPVITSSGKKYPVDIHYLPLSGVKYAENASLAVQQIVNKSDGDILVFLPGAAEIRQCQRLLQEASSLSGLLTVYPLYGELPFREQERAIQPSAKRKIVLATNIAETSLTIEGVGVVIDSGWSRIMRFDPSTGLNRLVTIRVSAAAAEQRAGRAGRLGPGVCYRLWSEHEQHNLLPFHPAEIKTADLSQLILQLALWGVTDANALHWLDQPPVAALVEGRQLLQRLGALDQHGMITPEGKDMARLPLHPRLARMLLCGQARGNAELACNIAALLSERDIFRGVGVFAEQFQSPSDLLDRLEALNMWRERGPQAELQVRLDKNACQTVEKIAIQLCRLLGVRNSYSEVDCEEIGILVAHAYPDRIAHQREPGSNRYLLANGRGVSLSSRSAVHNKELLVAVTVEGGEGNEGVIHLATSISIEVVRKEFASDIRQCRVVCWDRQLGRVVAREDECYAALILSSRQIVPLEEELINALLQGVHDGLGLAALSWTPQAEQLCNRVLFLSRLFPTEEWPDFSSEALLTTLSLWLGPYVSGKRSLAELASINILPPLQARLTWDQQRRLDDGAPTHISVPSGSRIVLNYQSEGPPVLAVKLQEMFGLAQTPTVAWGKVAVILHLLSPARRPVQVTQDLQGFWGSGYQEVKKELRGRYPKHPWPDDPWKAMPTRHTKGKR